MSVYLYNGKDLFVCKKSLNPPTPGLVTLNIPTKTYHIYTHSLSDIATKKINLYCNILGTKRKMLSYVL